MLRRDCVLVRSRITAVIEKRRILLVQSNNMSIKDHLHHRVARNFVCVFV